MFQKEGDGRKWAAGDYSTAFIKLGVPHATHGVMAPKHAPPKSAMYDLRTFTSRSIAYHLSQSVLP